MYYVIVLNWKLPKEIKILIARVVVWTIVAIKLIPHWQHSTLFLAALTALFFWPLQALSIGNIKLCFIL